MDKGIASLVQTYELSYHALSQRWLVRNLNTGEQQDFRHVRRRGGSAVDGARLPAFDADLVQSGRSFRGRRARGRRPRFQLRGAQLDPVLDRRLERRQRVVRMAAPSLNRALSAAFIGLGRLLWPR